MTGPWTSGPVPITMVGTRIENWTQVETMSWFRTVGTVIDLDGDPGLNPEQTTMEFHPIPPVPTEDSQVWRAV